MMIIAGEATLKSCLKEVL